MTMFNSYLTHVDLGPLRTYCEEHGRLCRYSKGEAFLSEGETGHTFGLVAEGYFKYAVTDTAGDNVIVGFAFTGEFVSDFYNSFQGFNSEGSIIAGSQADVYLITFNELNKWSEQNMPEFEPAISTALYRMLYTRYLDSYRKTPKERYMDFIREHPDLLQVITLKELASYLRITPIYLSRIRKEVHAPYTDLA